MFAWIRRKYDELCGRIEDKADRLEAERRTIEAGRKELKALNDTIAKADRLLDRKDR